MYFVNVLPRIINIGYQGEGEVTSIQFDVSDWVAAYPSLPISISFTDPQDSTNASPFLASGVTLADGILTWLVGKDVTQHAGFGTIVVRCADGDVDKRSAMTQILIEQGHGATGDAPELMADWLGEAATLRQEIADGAQAAAGSAETATTKAGEAASSAQAANTSAGQADTAKLAAEAARDTATTKAGEASESAEQAAQSAAVYDALKGRVDGHDTQLAEKANKAATPTLNHIATLDAAGSLKDSGRYLHANDNAWYTGRDLKALYGDAATFMAALRTGAPFDIRIGDYWPITLSGTIRDVGSYTCPSGTTYYSDTGLTTSVGSTGQVYEATYVNATYCRISISSTTYYVSTAACLAYFVRTLSNAVVNLEVAGINLYYNHGDTALTVPHILFCPRDCLPIASKMRKTDAIWHSEATTNPWLGSAMYATLNDATYGLLPLIAATDIGAYIYGGPNGAGMRTFLPDMASGVNAPTNWTWRDRGKLFLPMEREVWGSAIHQANGLAGALSVQWPIFIGTLRHIVKGSGNAGSRTAGWCATATGAASFALVGAGGYPSDSGAAKAAGVAPCFLVA